MTPVPLAGGGVLAPALTTFPPTRGKGIALLAALALAACAPREHASIGTPPLSATNGGVLTAKSAIAPSDAAQVTAVPAGMQYLYGSGEGAAASLQAWHGLVGYVAGRIRARPRDSVVLDESATLAMPRFVACGAKPFAAVFDVDETVLLNLGAEYDAAIRPGPFDPRRWDAWERTGATKVTAVPGAREALAALRRMGVTVVFNTNRSATNAERTRAAIEGAGLGPAVHGRTLWLKGDDNTGGLKDARRWRIADSYCVVAMAGDQLGDFSDLFNAGPVGATAPSTSRRRADVSVSPLSTRWGAGWFVLPNPVYGTALKGGVDDVFPADKRWTPSQPQEAN